MGLVTVVALVVAMGAYGVWAFFFWSGCSFPEPGSRACAGEVGFASLDDVEILDANKDSWLDTFISFQLRGSPEAIDDVLAAAEFSTPLSEDVDLFSSVVHVHPDLDDRSAFTNVRYGTDTWTDRHGRPVMREVVRADLPGEGSGSVLFVFASR